MKETHGQPHRAYSLGMIRTHVFPCSLSKTEADALNRESGRVYTSVLVRHYRVYRKKGHWLSQGAGERIEESTGLTLLHAHSRDAAQQAFYKACKTARTRREQGEPDVRCALPVPAQAMAHHHLEEHRHTVQGRRAAPGTVPGPRPSARGPACLTSTRIAGADN